MLPPNLDNLQPPTEPGDFLDTGDFGEPGPKSRRIVPDVEQEAEHASAKSESDRLEILRFEWTEVASTAGLRMVFADDLTSARGVIADEILREAKVVVQQDAQANGDLVRLTDGLLKLDSQLKQFRRSNRRFGDGRDEEFPIPVRPEETVRKAMQRLAAAAPSVRKADRLALPGVEASSEPTDLPSGEVLFPGCSPVETESRALAIGFFRAWRASIEVLNSPEDSVSLVSPELKAARPDTVRRSLRVTVPAALAFLALAENQVATEDGNKHWEGHDFVDGLLEAAIAATLGTPKAKTVERCKADTLFVLLAAHEHAQSEQRKASDGVAGQERFIQTVEGELSVRQGIRLVTAATENAPDYVGNPVISPGRASALADWGQATLDTIEWRIKHEIGFNQFAKARVSSETEKFRNTSTSAPRMISLGTIESQAALDHWSRLCRIVGLDDLITWENTNG